MVVETSSEQMSPLSEADPRSIDEIFSSKPPFDPLAMQKMIAEFRRMREKWQIDEAEGRKSRATKSARSSSEKANVGDLFGD